MHSSRLHVGLSSRFLHQFERFHSAGPKLGARVHRRRGRHPERRRKVRRWMQLGPRKGRRLDPPPRCTHPSRLQNIPK